MEKEAANKKIEQILGLETPLIAVKIVKMEETLPNLKSPPQKSRYCQLLMLARKGQTLMLTAEDLACPAAKAALGFAPLPEKIASGEMLCSLGLFMTSEAAAKTMSMIPRIRLGSTRAVAAGPLRSFHLAPDVIVVEGLPEQVMWLCLARNCKHGGRLNFSSSIFQCCCVDVTVVPYITGEVNISPGCYGCREATDTPPEHMFMGIPAKLIDEVTESLEFLSKKAMITVREKRVYKAYMAAMKGNTVE
jgi:uncharacterized protein (DUF169 family)